jgi:hypothetical protein
MLGIRLVRGTDPLALWLVGIMSAGAIFQSFNAIEFWLESRLQWRFSAIAKSAVLLLGCLVKIGLILDLKLKRFIKISSVIVPEMI